MMRVGCWGSSVDLLAVQLTTPRPILITPKVCGGRIPPWETPRNDKPVCESRIAWSIVLMVIVTGSVCSLIVNDPEYVPGGSPDGLAVTVSLTPADGNACPDEADTDGQAPPALVLALVVNANVPPPAFETS